MLRALDLAEALEAGDLAPSGVVELIAEAVDAREAEILAFAHLDLDRLRLDAQGARPSGDLRGNSSARDAFSRNCPENIAENFCSKLSGPDPPTVS